MGNIFDKTKEFAGDQWGSAKSKARNTWNSANNPLTQKQKAEAYDPNAANFGLYGDPNAAKAEAQRAQGLAASQAGNAATANANGIYQEQLGTTAQGTATGLRSQAYGADGRTGPYMQDPTAGRAGALSGQSALYALARQPEGPSAAQAMLSSQSAQAMRQNLALARSGRGAGSAQAMRSALGQNAIMQGDAANAATALRAREYQDFRNRQAGLVTAGAQQAMGIYGQDSGLAQAQLQADLTSRAQNDALRLGLGNQALGYEQTALGRTSAAQGYGQQGLGYVQLGLGYEQLAQGYGQLGLQGTMGYEQLKGEQVLGASTANAQFEQQRDASLGGMATTGLGGLVSLSDRRAKTHVEELGNIRALLDGKSSKRVARDAKPYRYRYDKAHRDKPEAGRGTFVGPMAQDLEKSPLGKTLVREQGGTKMVDTGRAGLVALSAVREALREIDGIKDSLGSSRKSNSRRGNNTQLGVSA